MLILKYQMLNVICVTTSGDRTMYCCIWWSLCLPLVKVEIGRACSMDGGEEECIQDFGGEARKKETTRKT
jgi:hypothetical protein